ncbi:MAG: outer membrane beta-barrel protein [Planctomycetaceae bacterium]|nr:outer membrane beta-barrel protein [Planctomycetaceae bacterium]
MHFTARIATLSIVVGTICCPAVFGRSPRLNTSQAHGKSVARTTAASDENDDEVVDLEVIEADVAVRQVAAPPIPTQLGDDILQDTLSPHESVVEAAPPIYSHDPSGGPLTTTEPDSSQVQPYRGGGAQTPHQHRLRAHLENRPRQTPLQTESWLNRPYGMSYFVGALFLADPLPGLVGGDPGVTYGGRLSWDMSPTFGVETRIAGASNGVKDLLGGADLAPAGSFYWDVNWMWYWTGDTRWRPYFTVGGGLLDIDYYDAFQHRYHNTVFTLPFGVGMKYRHSTRLALRLDLMDNYAFSSGLQGDMHNVSLTAGMELRFGGARQRNYWPWNPSRGWW